MQIVVAWFNGSLPRSAMWIRNGTPQDVTEATRYVANLGGRVFEYERTEADPLGRARAQLMEAFGAKPPGEFLDVSGRARI